jgi:hypothetical protein
MRKFALAGMCTAIVASAAVVLAQEWTPPQPTKEHQWLKQFIGEWESVAEMSMGPGMPTEKMQGSEKVHALGDNWIVSNLEGEMPGGAGKMQGMMTVGYDAAKGKYVGTWVDSVMPHLWVYEGTVDETGKILTLNAVGPNMMGGEGMSNYRDITEFKSPDHRVLTSQAEGPDGTWITFMTANYTRKK